MKLESLVIAHQPWRGEYVPGPCTHRPSSHGSWEDLKPVAARRCQRLNQRLGLSRNKVAVPEGAAGTPPFWRRLVRLWFTVITHSKEFKSIEQDYLVVAKEQLKVKISPWACSSGG